MCVPFAKSDMCERRIGEHAIRHEPIARAARAAGEVIADDAKIVNRDMRELRAASTVADGPDIWRGRFKPFVHADVAARVQFDADRLESDASRIGDPPGRDEDMAAFDLLLAGRRADGEG